MQLMIASGTGWKPQAVTVMNAIGRLENETEGLSNRTPGSKRFLWALFLMETLNKPERFSKRSTWRVSLVWSDV